MTDHFFLALNNTALSGWTTGGLFTYLEGTLVASEFWQLWIMLLWTSGHRFLCGHRFLAPLGNCQGAWLLDHMIRVCVVLQETAALSSKVAAPFWIPISNEWESPLLHTLASTSTFLYLRMLLVKFLYQCWFPTILTIERLSFIYMSLTKQNAHLFICLCMCVCVPTAPYCSLTHTVKNGGVLNRTAGEVGSKVQYFCKPGYRMIGHSNATCRRNPVGMYQWDSLAPLCQGKKCVFHSQTWVQFIALILITTYRSYDYGLKGKGKLNVSSWKYKLNFLLTVQTLLTFALGLIELYSLNS